MLLPLQQPCSSTTLSFCCKMLQCCFHYVAFVAFCCKVLHLLQSVAFVAFCCKVLRFDAKCFRVLHYVAFCCIMLHFVALCFTYVVMLRSYCDDSDCFMVVFFPTCVLLVCLCTITESNFIINFISLFNFLLFLIFENQLPHFKFYFFLFFVCLLLMSLLCCCYFKPFITHTSNFNHPPPPFPLLVTSTRLLQHPKRVKFHFLPF